MSSIERQKAPGQAWNTVIADQGGTPSGGGLGIWKTYGVDSSNQPMDNVTVGNGTLTGRWWTPAAVDPATQADPFLCLIQIAFTLGGTSSVDGTLSVGYPKLVDGSGFDIAPVQTDAIGFVFGHVDSGPTFGVTTFGQITSSDGTAWDATHPGTWSDGRVIIVSASFEARFTPD